MPIANDLAWTSLVLSIAIVGIAISLGLHQWSEWRARDDNLVDLERTYFFRQDLRRSVGVLIMLLIALGIFNGSRISPVLTDAPHDVDVDQAVSAIAGSSVETWKTRHANPIFLTVWLLVIVLLVILLALVFFDWLATRRFAYRQRQSIARERLDILRETFRRPDTDRNGHPRGPGRNGA